MGLVAEVNLHFNINKTGLTLYKDFWFLFNLISTLCNQPNARHYFATLEIFKKYVFL